MSPDEGILHVYSPSAHHGDASVVGTRAGLALLRDALTWLLAQPTEGTATSVLTFTADGEGYHLDVMLEADSGMDAYVLPYTAPYATDPAQSEPYNDNWPKKRQHREEGGHGSTRRT
jgi:hypothetical protein